MREKRRRILSRAFVVPAVFLSMAFAALPVMAQAPAVIKLWDQHIHDKKFRQSIFKEFNKSNPDIKVEYTSQVSGTYQTILEAAMRSGTPPDIFYGVNVLPTLLEMGRVMPLDEVAPSKEELRRWMDRFPQGYRPFAENINVLNDKAYSWPSTGEAGGIMLYWNTKLFREAGLKGVGGGPAVPETWAEMRLFAKKITELGQGIVFGLAFGGKGNCGVWDMNIFSLAIAAGCPEGMGIGGGFNFKTGRWDYKPGMKEAVQLMLDIKKDGSIFPGEITMDDEQAKFKFSQDLAGMQFGGFWNLGGYLAVNPALEFDTGLVPTQERGVRKGYYAANFAAMTSEYVVSSKIKNRDAVWRVIQFMTSARFQEEWVKAGGGISVFPEYNKTEYYPHPAMAKVAQMGTTGKRTVPEFPVGMSKVQELANPLIGKPDQCEILEGIWIGRLGIDAFDDLERRKNNAWDLALVEARKEGVNLTRADFTFPDYEPTENYPPPKRK